MTEKINVDIKKQPSLLKLNGDAKGHSPIQQSAIRITNDYF